MLQVIDLSCIRNERKLFSPQNFTLQAGQALRIGGPNGSGKSTLLRTIMQLNQQYEGQIHISSRPLYIGHRSSLHPDLTVRQNLRYFGMIDVDFSYFGIDLYLDDYCRDLSAGQLQRVSLSRLLYATEDVWLLDEPFANLDIDAKQKLIWLCKKRLANLSSILIVSHEELDFGETICLN